MKAKRKRTPEQRDEDRRRGERVDRMLRERIAYHDAKLREERPGWTPPQTTEEWQAHYEAKWAQRDAARGESA